MQSKRKYEGDDETASSEKDVHGFAEMLVKTALETAYGDDQLKAMSFMFAWMQWKCPLATAVLKEAREKILTLSLFSPDEKLQMFKKFVALELRSDDTLPKHWDMEKECAYFFRHWGHFSCTGWRDESKFYTFGAVRDFVRKRLDLANEGIATVEEI